jgi:hypothetical protein
MEDSWSTGFFYFIIFENYLIKKINHVKLKLFVFHMKTLTKVIPNKLNHDKSTRWNLIIVTKVVPNKLNHNKGIRWKFNLWHIIHHSLNFKTKEINVSPNYLNKTWSMTTLHSHMLTITIKVVAYWWASLSPPSSLPPLGNTPTTKFVAATLAPLIIVAIWTNSSIDTRAYRHV